MVNYRKDFSPFFIIQKYYMYFSRINRDMEKTALITGSMSGLGLAFREVFIKHGYNVIDYDIILGKDQDINDPEVKDRLISDLERCDTFINNSWTQSQAELLDRASKLEHPLFIINVGSTSTEIPPPDEYTSDQMLKYIELKSNVQQVVQKIQYQQSLGEYANIWLLNLKLGYLDTKRHENKNISKLNTDEVASYVYNILYCYPKMILSEVTLFANSSLGGEGPNTDLLVADSLPT
jgi:hypothetical protein